MLSKDRYRIKRKFSIGMILIAVVLGALIGSTIGEALGVILPEGVVKDFLIKSQHLAQPGASICHSLRHNGLPFTSPSSA